MSAQRQPRAWRIARELAAGEVERFAYHAGPPDIVFAGRPWRRGVPQAVTGEELKSMTRRAGWVFFEFRRVAAHSQEK